MPNTVARKTLTLLYQLETPNKLIRGTINVAIDFKGPAPMAEVDNPNSKHIWIVNNPNLIRFSGQPMGSQTNPHLVQNSQEFDDLMRAIHKYRIKEIEGAKGNAKPLVIHLGAGIFYTVGTEWRTQASYNQEYYWSLPSNTSLVGELSVSPDQMDYLLIKNWNNEKFSLNSTNPESGKPYLLTTLKMDPMGIFTNVTYEYDKDKPTPTSRPRVDWKINVFGGKDLSVGAWHFGDMREFDMFGADGYHHYQAETASPAKNQFVRNLIIDGSFGEIANAIYVKKTFKTLDERVIDFSITSAGHLKGNDSWFVGNFFKGFGSTRNEREVFVANVSHSITVNERKHEFKESFRGGLWGRGSPRFLGCF